MDAWARLGAAVKARRLELGMSARGASERAGINRATWGALEDGDPKTGRYRQFSERNWAGVEDALDWARGSIQEVLGGGEPNPLPETSGQRRVVISEEIGAELQRIRDLPFPAETKLRMIQALLDVAEESASERFRPPNTDRDSGRRTA